MTYPDDVSPADMVPWMIPSSAPLPACCALDCHRPVTARVALREGPPVYVCAVHGRHVKVEVLP